VALESIMKNIKPILDNKSLWEDDFTDIGFAVAIDFCPKEQMGLSAELELLAGFECNEQQDGFIH
jgi:hypothetical protein